MRVLRAVLAAMLVCTYSIAEYRYDYNTGNSYTVTDSIDGSKEIRGFNYNNGSSWRATMDSDGNARGTDSNGNAFKYNSDSGSYFNYGTGQTCYGKGSLRNCY